MLLRSQATPHSAEPAAKPSSDRLYTRPGPNRAASQALTGTTTPKASE